MSNNCGCPVCQKRMQQHLSRQRFPTFDAKAHARKVQDANDAARAAFLREDGGEITHAGQCLLVNDQTGVPLANCPYTIVLEDGTEIRGVTNDSGYTQLVQTSNQPYIRVKVSP